MSDETVMQAADRQLADTGLHAVTPGSVERLRAERDEARAEVERLRRERDEARAHAARIMALPPRDVVSADAVIAQLASVLARDGARERSNALASALDTVKLHRGAMRAEVERLRVERDEVLGWLRQWRADGWRPATPEHDRLVEWLDDEGGDDE